MKLKRSIYGSNNAPCSWCKKVNQELTNLKGIGSTYDNALFLLDDTTGNLMDILVMHVDDFILCGNDLFQKKVIAKLKKTYESGTFRFWELGIKQTQDGITIEQNLYVSSIIDIKKGRSLRKNHELSQEKTIKKTDRSNDVDIYLDTTWCSIWCVGWVILESFQK